MRSIFNGWVVRNHGGQWELLVQRVISPRLPGLGLAVGGHTNPGESLDACMVRTLREALGVSEAARVERIGREVFQADEFQEEDEEIVDLLIEVPTSGPERWRSTQKAPELSNQSFELDSEWRPLAERIELNGSGAAETLAEVRRRLGASAPAPYVIVRWRADPDIEADPDEVAAALLAGRSHPAVLPMRSDEIPKDWDRLLPSATFVRDGPKAVGIVFRIAPDLDENARDQRVDWAMAPWPTDPLVAYDPQRRRFYQANWSTWRNYGPALARCPGVMVDFDAEFIAALMDAWQRPLMVWDHLPPFDADGNPFAGEPVTGDPSSCQFSYQLGEEWGRYTFTLKPDDVILRTREGPLP